MAGRAPLLHPRRSGSESEGRRFFIDEPGTMERLRRKSPWLARRLELPDFTAPTGALPGCRARLRSRVAEGRPGETVLNLGSGVHKQYANERLVNFDIAPHDNADVVGDGERLPFRDEVFDGVLLDAVVEHLARPHRVVAEVRRVLKPGGTVLAQVPFLYPFHAAPHDYQRYTPAGLRMLFEEFELIEAGTDRRPGRAVLEILTAYAATWSDNRNLSYALRLLTAWAWLPLKLFDPWLARRNKAEYVAASASILARKPGGGEAAAPASRD
jgi:SAM-dependent methyltransferase